MKQIDTMSLLREQFTLLGGSMENKIAIFLINHGAKKNRFEIKKVLQRVTQLTVSFISFKRYVNHHT